MSTNQIYSVSKIAFHPEALQALREGAPQPPLIVQLMPSNLCNQACSFCSYGSGPESVRAKVANPDKALWKNQELFGTRDMIPSGKLMETVDELALAGVKCVEVTGGGEPTLHPDFDELCARIAACGMELALVTNGTRIDPRRAERLGQLPFTWVRVSVDAGNAEDYVAVRNTPLSHWERAWEAVAFLSAQAKQPYAHPESTVGVGFVIDRGNWRGVYDACRLAMEAGAHNIRISTSFTPDGLSRFDQECRETVPPMVQRAKADFERAGFTIHDLSTERWHNTALGRQEYPFCYWKEVGCVIGADQNVYACCSWSYNQMGLMGTIRDKPFREMWFGEGAAWRAQHDPRRDCRIHCLYEQRNIEALRLMGDRVYEQQVAAAPRPGHLSFV
jgi:MoaA/NifB/PqqE/SkfB family radical SAM enzyme